MKTIVAESRSLIGKRAKQVRQLGKIPGILYGTGTESQPIQIRAAELRQAIRHHGVNRPYRMQVNGREVPVMIAEVQQTPLDAALLHVDFKQIDLNEGVETSVPLSVTGKTSSGQHIMHAHEILVRCLPSEIPQMISIPLDGLEAGDSVKAGALVLPKNVELLHDPEAPILTIEAKRELVTEETPLEPEADDTIAE